MSEGPPFWHWLQHKYLKVLVCHSPLESMKWKTGYLLATALRGVTDVAQVVGAAAGAVSDATQLASRRGFERGNNGPGPSTVTGNGAGTVLGTLGTAWTVRIGIGETKCNLGSKSRDDSEATFISGAVEDQTKVNVTPLETITWGYSCTATQLAVAMLNFH
ncbi:hypothetical protein N431DRAFT_475525 [Stipitochalara longipes BDJ]|nr:hypothetical protein N431DRAFT_475525 [Stipitochalara longipes BDJ]